MPFVLITVCNIQRKNFLASLNRLWEKDSEKVLTESMLFNAAQAIEYVVSFHEKDDCVKVFVRSKTFDQIYSVEV